MARAQGQKNKKNHYSEGDKSGEERNITISAYVIQKSEFQYSSLM